MPEDKQRCRACSHLIHEGRCQMWVECYRDADEQCDCVMPAATGAPSATGLDCVNENLTDLQIKYMRDRFLNWTLPRDLNPDGGISFKRSESAVKYNHPWPVGTNFLTATQAEEMVRHMIDGMTLHEHAATGAPGDAATVMSKSVVRRVAAMNRPVQSVYGIFHSDGFECEHLLGVFLDKREADAIGDKIGKLLKAFSESREMRGAGPSPAIIFVKPLTVGSYVMPADAAYMEEKNAKRK